MLQILWAQPPNDYPTSDGKPMGETELHRDLIYDVLRTLELHFRDQSHVHVTGNLLWFYRENDRRRHLSPDVMVIFGVPKGKRENFLQWEEGCAPQVVVEISSKTTQPTDSGGKFFLYEDLGVEEYYQFDPREEAVSPRLISYHRCEGKFTLMDGKAVYSPRLGLEFVEAGQALRLRLPGAKEFLPTPEQAAYQEAQAAKAATEAAKAATRAALKKVRRLEERLRELGIDPD